MLNTDQTTTEQDVPAWVDVLIARTVTEAEVTE